MTGLSAFCGHGALPTVADGQILPATRAAVTVGFHFMSDRLSDLRRQRELVAEQLAWLDREIANASEQAAPAPPAAATPAPDAPASALAAPILPPAPTPAPKSVVKQQAAQILAAASPASGENLPAAEQILDQYRVAPDSLRTDVRKGCLLYFVAAFGLLILGVIALYFAFRHGK